MPDATFHFPNDFRWGVVTAAHQVEGNNANNDWWTWEQEEGRIAQAELSGPACNWWEDAEADFDRAAALGTNALRLSVEWSRIEPQPGSFDDRALVRYREMVEGLKGRGIEPMITLHHFTNPRWLTEGGGWENSETVERFARFVEHVVSALAPACDLWCTLNAPNVCAHRGYADGVWPPGKSDRQTARRVVRHLMLAHAEAYRVIHEVQPEARVGFAHHMKVFDPLKSGSPADRFVTSNVDRAYNGAILAAVTRGIWRPPLGFGLARRVRGTLDWIGLNYYTRELVAFDRHASDRLFSRQLHADDAEMLDGGFGELYPAGIMRSLERLAELDLPIYITGNGIPDDDDDQRPRYLLKHLHQVWHAVQRCYPVMGYYHRTLVDSFEWDKGWTLRFGLIGLNRRTQQRMPRLSAELYANLIRANAITPSLIDTYAPELRAQLLPGKEVEQGSEATSERND